MSITRITKLASGIVVIEGTISVADMATTLEQLVQQILNDACAAGIDTVRLHLHHPECPNNPNRGRKYH